MSNDGFVVTGSRPPSALGSYSYRPSSAKHGYHTLSRSSAVDESLFRSHYSTKLDETFSNFKAPWEYPKPPAPRNTFGPPAVRHEPEPKPRGPPLLWCPPPSETSLVKPKSKTKSNHNDSTYLWSTKNNFRQLKHTPTFVDETLFGSKLEEPSFEAPWNERKKGEKRNPKPYLWDPYCDKKRDMPTEQLSRPVSALRSSSRNESRANTPRPVWKP